MTIEQASKRFNMSVDEIRKYLAEGYIEKNGDELEESDFENMGLISTLLKTGMAKQDVCRYLELLKLQGTENERIRLLRGYRAKLLDEIHKKQQSLDHIDYIIYEINKQNKTEVGYETLKNFSDSGNDDSYGDFICRLRNNK